MTEDTAEFQLMFDPALGLRASDFAEAWADLPECTAAGACEARRGATRSFDMDPAMVALITLGTTLAKDLIVELIKRALARADERQKKKQATSVVVEQVPDAATGLPIFRVGVPRKDS